MHRKVYKRPDDDGLTDALFDAMELLRDGAISHQEAASFASLAQVQLAHTTNKQRERALALEERRIVLEESSRDQKLLTVQSEYQSRPDQRDT